MIIYNQTLTEIKVPLFYDKNVKIPYIIQNREYYGLKDFILCVFDTYADDLLRGVLDASRSGASHYRK